MGMRERTRDADRLESLGMFFFFLILLITGTLLLPEP